MIFAPVSTFLANSGLAHPAPRLCLLIRSNFCTPLKGVPRSMQSCPLATLPAWMQALRIRLKRLLLASGTRILTLLTMEIKKRGCNASSKLLTSIPLLIRPILPEPGYLKKKVNVPCHQTQQN